MLPVLRDYVSYIKTQVEKGAKRGLAVIITDSQVYDAADIKAYSAQVAVKKSKLSRLPKLNFVLVGVGAQIDEEQMEEICHEEYPGVGHLWCHRVADRMEEMAELVKVLVDETHDSSKRWNDRSTTIKAPCSSATNRACPPFSNSTCHRDARPSRWKSQDRNSRNQFLTKIITMTMMTTITMLRL